MKRLLAAVLVLGAVATFAGPLEDANGAGAKTRRDACAIARHAALQAAAGKPILPLPVRVSGLLAKQMPCFVTISYKNTRRHCMGAFRPMSSSLGVQIAETSVKAWRQDRRRKALSAEELGGADYIVTIPGSRKTVANPAPYPPADYGLVVTGGRLQAVLLPGEAKTTRWQVAEAKRQAGIPPGTSVRFEVFRAVTWRWTPSAPSR